MTEDQLLGPRAHGKPCGSAVLKAVAEDFQVDEVLDIPLSGEGEHLWLWVEKRNLNTEEAAKRIARAAGVPLKMISYAGLKDRQALTRQWFSLHLPGKADPDLSAAEVALKYKQLWTVEDLFRDLKSLLQTRPICHHHERSRSARTCPTTPAKRFKPSASHRDLSFARSPRNARPPSKSVVTKFLGDSLTLCSLKSYKTEL